MTTRRSEVELGVVVEDVFGDLPGGPGAATGQGPGSRPDLGALESVLDGARLWGLELEPRFRVLAATLEPTESRYRWGRTQDRRVQLLCSPVSTILGSLRREEPTSTEILAFGEEQLVDVVTLFDGASVHGPLFGRPEPRPREWGPRFSMEGRSTAPDGTSTTILLATRHENLTLELFARFDEVELRAPDGTELRLPA